MAEGRKGGKKNRKYGRNKVTCKLYRDRDRETINRKRRFRTMIRQQPNNAQLLARYETEFGKYQADRPLNARASRLLDRRLAA